MKKFFLLATLILGGSAYAQPTKVQDPKAGSSVSQSGNPVSEPGSARIYRCCAKIYLVTPTLAKNKKPVTKLVTGNPFSGKNRGIDLSMDFLDPKGIVVGGLDGSLSTTPSGDIHIDAAKLPKGQKLRLRLKAGSAVETYLIQ